VISKTERTASLLSNAGKALTAYVFWIFRFTAWGEDGTMADMIPFPVSMVSWGRHYPHPREGQFAVFLLAIFLLAAGGSAADPLAAKSHDGPMKLAKAAFERGDYHEAEKIYESLLAKDPDNLPALDDLGVVRFHAGELVAAEDAFLRAIAVAPKDGFSHCALGVVYYSQGRYNEAADALTTSLTINPKNGTAEQYLGLITTNKGWRAPMLWEAGAAEEIKNSTKINPMIGDFLTPLEQSRLRLPRAAK
jgi:tetratricopeptide (TPR) repeat protein